MALLLDHLVEAKMMNPPKSIEDPVVILANNVSDYYYLGSPQEVWDDDDFPNIAPPFQRMWLEWKRPSKSNRNGEMVDIGNTYRMGIYIESQSDEEEMRQTLEMCKEKGFVPNEKPRWICISVVYAMDKTFGCGMICRIMWCVNGEGRHIGFNKDNQRFIILLENEQMDRVNSMGADTQTILNQTVLCTHVPFLAISLMHCKNTELVKSPPISPALQKARVRDGKHPLLRHRTILIEPMKRIIHEASGPSNGLTKAALHICRGHFKDYRQRGLFGKLHGIYWWEMQARGDITEGVIDKSYDIKPGGKS